MWLHHSLALWLWASYTVPCSLASTMGMLNYCGLSSDRFLRCPTHSRCSVYVDLLSPLATLSLKTHIPSGFVLSPPESTRGTSSRGSPARGHVTCPEQLRLLGFSALMLMNGCSTHRVDLPVLWLQEPWAEALLSSPPLRPPALGSQASQGKSPGR